MSQSLRHFIHFSACARAAASWIDEHSGTFLLSVTDAHRLGQLVNEAVFGEALGAAVPR